MILRAAELGRSELDVALPAGAGPVEGDEGVRIHDRDQNVGLLLGIVPHLDHERGLGRLSGAPPPQRSAGDEGRDLDAPEARLRLGQLQGVGSEHVLALSHAEVEPDRRRARCLDVDLDEHLRIDRQGLLAEAGLAGHADAADGAIAGLLLAVHETVAVVVQTVGAVACSFGLGRRNFLAETVGADRPLVAVATRATAAIRSALHPVAGRHAGENSPAGAVVVEVGAGSAGALDTAERVGAQVPPVGTGEGVDEGCEPGGNQVRAVRVGHAATLDRGVDAANLRIAGVRGADVAVVAVDVRVDTADGRVAGIVGAEVRVVAVHEKVGATRDRVAGVRGAEVRVVAVRRLARDALAVRAHVVLGARVVVGAVRGVVGVEAPEDRIAGVVGADVVVFAVRRLATHAHAVGAHVVLGARVVVGAVRGVVGVDAARCRLAGVVGAGVEVVAGERRARDADAVGADVAIGARVGVVAVRGVVAGLADPQVAHVVGAGILIVAVRIGHALTLQALIDLAIAVVVLAVADLGRAGVGQRVGVVAVPQEEGLLRRLDAGGLELGRGERGPAVPIAVRDEEVGTGGLRHATRDHDRHGQRQREAGQGVDEIPHDILLSAVVPELNRADPESSNQTVSPTSSESLLPLFFHIDSSP